MRQLWIDMDPKVRSTVLKHLSTEAAVVGQLSNELNTAYTIAYALLNDLAVEPPITIYKVGEEPDDWKGDTILGWKPPRDEFCHPNEWRPVLWHGRGYWSPGGDLNGDWRPTHVRLMPEAPEVS